MLCCHSAAHRQHTLCPSEAEQTQQTRCLWLPALSLGQVCERQNPQARAVLISTGKRPCPSMKASCAAIVMCFRWLNEKMSKSLPGFLLSNQLSKTLNILIPYSFKMLDSHFSI